MADVERLTSKENPGGSGKDSSNLEGADTEVKSEKEQETIILQTGFTGPDKKQIGLRVDRPVFERMAGKYQELGFEPKILKNKRIVFAAAGAAAAGIAGLGLVKYIRDKKEEDRMIEEKQGENMFFDINQISKGESGIITSLSETESGGEKIPETAEKEKINLTEEQKGEFGQIYETYYPRIFAFIKMKADISDADASDLAEYVFIRAMNKYAEFIPREDLKNPVLSWLYQIANRLVLNYFRDLKKRKTTSFEQMEEESGREIFQSRQPSPEKEAETTDEWEEFGRAFAKLNPSYKLLLALQSDGLLTDEDIAYILETTVGAVKSATFRARKRLRIILKKLREGEKTKSLKHHGYTIT